MNRLYLRRWICACLALLAAPRSYTQSKPAPSSGQPGNAETLSYSIEWRLIYAGSARMSYGLQGMGSSHEWESKLHLESAGLVSKLYKLEDNYRVEMQDNFCATSSQFDAVEGNRRHQTNVTFDRNAHKATYLERDLVKNAVIHTAETEIPACVSDVIGGLYKLRSLHLATGPERAIGAERRQEGGVGARGREGKRRDHHQGGQVYGGPLRSFRL